MYTRPAVDSFPVPPNFPAPRKKAKADASAICSASISSKSVSTMAVTATRAYMTVRMCWMLYSKHIASKSAMCRTRPVIFFGSSSGFFFSSSNPSARIDPALPTSLPRLWAAPRTPPPGPEKASLRAFSCLSTDSETSMAKDDTCRLLLFPTMILRDSDVMLFVSLEVLERRNILPDVDVIRRLVVLAIMDERTIQEINGFLRTISALTEYEVQNCTNAFYVLGRTEFLPSKGRTCVAPGHRWFFDD